MLEHRLYTWPERVEGEGAILNALFMKGLPWLHLRKPSSRLKQCQVLLEQIDAVYHPRIILHQHWELAQTFEVGGLHWTEHRRASSQQFAPLVAEQKTQGYQVGTAIHHPAQLAQLPASLDYVTVSPIFESLSKPNYKAIYEWKEEGNYPFVLVALGGIAPDKLKEVQARGFGSVALLGAVWKPSDAVLQNYEKLCLALQQVGDLMP